MHNVVWSFLHEHLFLAPFRSTHSSPLLPNSYSFFFLYITHQLQLCYPHIPECGAIYWSVTYLPRQSAYLKENSSLPGRKTIKCQQISASMEGLMISPHVHAGMFIDLTLFRKLQLLWVHECSMFVISCILSFALVFFLCFLLSCTFFFAPLSSFLLPSSVRDLVFLSFLCKSMYDSLRVLFVV